MALSLYELCIPSYLQSLAAVAAFLEKGRAFCETEKMDPETLVETRLHTDMRPLRFQLVSVAHHSFGAIEAVKNGMFVPPPSDSKEDYAGLQKLVAEARQHLEKQSADELNAREGKEIILKLGERETPFITQDFLQSFSIPNFYFHATTAYGILRHKGVPLGKRDYLGRTRPKKS